MSACITCGADPCANPSFCAACRDADRRRARGEQPRKAEAEKPPPATQITATPFRWPDPATIPRRQFLLGRHYIRKTISATIAAGGRGKTTLGILEAISMTC